MVFVEIVFWNKKYCWLKIIHTHFFKKSQNIYTIHAFQIRLIEKSMICKFAFPFPLKKRFSSEKARSGGSRADSGFKTGSDFSFTWKKTHLVYNVNLMNRTGVIWVTCNSQSLFGQASRTDINFSKFSVKIYNWQSKALFSVKIKAAQQFWDWASLVYYLHLNSHDAQGIAFNPFLC